jgi:hypothetical protein
LVATNLVNSIVNGLPVVDTVRLHTVNERKFYSLSLYYWMDIYSMLIVLSPANAAHSPHLFASIENMNPGSHEYGKQHSTLCLSLMPTDTVMQRNLRTYT